MIQKRLLLVVLAVGILLQAGEVRPAWDRNLAYATLAIIGAVGVAASTGIIFYCDKWIVPQASREVIERYVKRRKIARIADGVAAGMTLIGLLGAWLTRDDCIKNYMALIQRAAEDENDEVVPVSVPVVVVSSPSVTHAPVKIVKKTSQSGAEILTRVLQSIVDLPTIMAAVKDDKTKSIGVSDKGDVLLNDGDGWRVLGAQADPNAIVPSAEFECEKEAFLDYLLMNNSDELDKALPFIETTMMFKALKRSFIGISRPEMFSVQRKETECGSVAGVACLQGSRSDLTDYCDVINDERGALFVIYSDYEKSGFYSDAALIAEKAQKFSKELMELMGKASLKDAVQGYVDEHMDFCGSAALLLYDKTTQEFYATIHDSGEGDRAHILVIKVGNKGRVAVIASPGLWSVMSRDEVALFVEEKITEGKSYATIAKYLAAKAHLKGSPYNISATIVDLRGLSRV
ncbi:MAG: hypothetical protein QG604_601 [Candidatus Dependentiae bacterium]|nr:hypothetical protein [Candidatus Dependentiae bacterium]